MVKGIGEYGIIGNSRTAALVGNDGSIDWLCLPFLNSPSVFAALLDQNKGGRFVLSPAEPFDSTTLYRPGTNILTTAFRTAGAWVRLTDFMAVEEWSDEIPDDENIRLYRCAEVTDGEAEIVLHFTPRFDYARAEDRLEISGEAVLAWGGEQRLNLLSSQPGMEVDVSESRTVARNWDYRFSWIRDAALTVEGIPALTNPKYVSAKKADYMRSDEDVLGVFLGEVARAYPIRILSWHEVVNDEFGDEPVLVSW